jgi:hypothetical protein
VLEAHQATVQRYGGQGDKILLPPSSGLRAADETTGPNRTRLFAAAVCKATLIVAKVDRLTSSLIGVCLVRIGDLGHSYPGNLG